MASSITREYPISDLPSIEGIAVVVFVATEAGGSVPLVVLTSLPEEDTGSPNSKTGKAEFLHGLREIYGNNQVPLLPDMVSVVTGRTNDIPVSNGDGPFQQTAVTEIQEELGVNIPPKRLELITNTASITGIQTKGLPNGNKVTASLRVENTPGEEAKVVIEYASPTLSVQQLIEIIDQAMESRDITIICMVLHHIFTLTFTDEEWQACQEFLQNQRRTWQLVELANILNTDHQLRPLTHAVLQALLQHINKPA